MTRLISPILAFTSDEIWQCYAAMTLPPIRTTCCSTRCRRSTGVAGGRGFHCRAGTKSIMIRDDAKKALEIARNEQGDRLRSLDAKVAVVLRTDELYDFVTSV